MQNSTTIPIFVVAAVALSLIATSSILADAYAQSGQTQCQIGALLGYAGTIFGVANVCTDGSIINVDLATNYLPQSGKVFEAWLVDDVYGSGYVLSIGKFLSSGTLSFNQIMTNARTYTDIIVTQEPANDLSPFPSWSNAVAQTWLLPPFGL
jgi:hypothetical protein